MRVLHIRRERETRTTQNGASPILKQQRQKNIAFNMADLEVMAKCSRDVGREVFEQSAAASSVTRNSGHKRGAGAGVLWSQRERKA